MDLSRRAVLTSGAALAAAGALPAAAAVAPVAEIALVMNSADASVSVIDMATRREIRREPVLREPHHWTLSPDGRTLLVGDAAGNALFSFDPATGAPLGHQVCADPYQLWISPRGSVLVVAALRLDHIDIYDAAGRTLKKRIAARSMPSHIAFSPDEAMVFVTLQRSGAVMAIDLARLAPVWTQPSGPTPAGIVWHDGRLLVACMGSDHVAEMDPADGRVLRRIVTGKGTHIIAPAPDGDTIYVGNRVGGTLTALDAATLKPRQSFTLSGGPDCIAFAPDGKLWITRRFTTTVAVLDPASGSVEPITVGRSPHGIFLSSVLPAARRDPAAALGTASV